MAVHPDGWFSIETEGSHGYRQVIHIVNGERQSFLLHRLTYVAEHGFESLQNHDVRLRNGVEWDNRASNLGNQSCQPPEMYHNEGYEFFSCQSNGTREEFAHHRLLFVAEYGLGALEPEDHVHHRNHIRWDNRPENLEAQKPDKHCSYHARQRENDSPIEALD